MLAKNVTALAGLVVSAGLAQADVSISNNATANMSCDAGICTATAQKAVLNAGDLQAMLGSGDVTVRTGSVAKDIEINSPLSWTNASRLALDAQRSVVVKKPVSVVGTGAIEMITSDGLRRGDLTFGARGRIDFTSLASDLEINGKPYFLVASIDGLAERVLQHPGGNIALVANYDAAEDGVYPAPPVNTFFYGTFNGLGHRVSHVFVSDQSTTSVGFFGRLDGRGEIASLNIRNSVIVGSFYVGGVAGFSAGRVTDCSVEGEIRGNYAGGLVGRNEGTLSLGRSYARVRGNYAGGVAGQNIGLVERTFATGRVSNASQLYGNIGGLVGINSGDSIGEAGTIANGYALGDAKVSQSSAVGGLVGYNPQNSEIVASYSTGTPSGKTGSLVGGFAGTSTGTVENSYWDVTTSGTSEGVGDGSSAGITGLTDTELKSGLPAGFDSDVWASNPAINNGYPYLVANPPR